MHGPLPENSQLVLALVLAGAILYFFLTRLTAYQTDGQLILPGLKAAVKMVRDEKGIIYIQAKNMENVLLAHGFVTAKDRIFQMQLTKMFAQGRLAEFLGPQSLPSDRCCAPWYSRTWRPGNWPTAPPPKGGFGAGALERRGQPVLALSHRLLYLGQPHP
ncbi:hypothetical protein DFAR_2320001 [Desulfarculales bacterium]